MGVDFWTPSFTICRIAETKLTSTSDVWRRELVNLYSLRSTLQGSKPPLMINHKTKTKTKTKKFRRKKGNLQYAPQNNLVTYTLPP